MVRRRVWVAVIVPLLAAVMMTVPACGNKSDTAAKKQTVVDPDANAQPGVGGMKTKAG